MDANIKGQISKAFSLQGLQLKPDAMKYIVSLLQEKNDSGLLERILNSIDKSSCMFFHITIKNTPTSQHKDNDTTHYYRGEDKDMK